MNLVNLMGARTTEMVRAEATVGAEAVGKACEAAAQSRMWGGLLPGTVLPWQLLHFMPTPNTNWVFTTRADKLTELKSIQDEASYLVVGLEEGDEGYLHYQGFVQLRDRWSLIQLKGLARTTHFEVRKGTVDEAVSYCKKDGVWFEMGQPIYERSRTDIRAFVDDAKVLDARAMYVAHPGPMVRYLRSYNDIQSRFAQARPGAELYWIWGPPGVGKTSYARLRDPGAYVKSPTDWWWQGYNQEEAVVIDEITGAIPFSTLLVLGDPGVRRLPTKGGDTVFAASRVYITSNHPPDQVYVLDSRDEGRWGALCRRVRFYTCRRVRDGVSELVGHTWGPMGWAESGYTALFNVPGHQPALRELPPMYTP